MAGSRDQAEAESGPEVDARRLAREVARRELDLSARPLATGVRNKKSI